MKISKRLLKTAIETAKGMVKEGDISRPVLHRDFPDDVLVVSADKDLVVLLAHFVGDDNEIYYVGAPKDEALVA